MRSAEFGLQNDQKRFTSRRTHSNSAFCNPNSPLKWSGWRDSHPRPPPSEGGRLLLTLHPEKLAARVGLAPTPCGLTNRRATLTPPGNGAAGRNSTCIVPLRRRVPQGFGHGSDLKLVSAAGIAPAVTRSQAGHVAATPRAGRPGVLGAHRGLCFLGIAGPTHLEPVSRGKKRKLADPKGVAPVVAVRKHLPADNGLLR